jgi:ABC-type multidrug transport system fused ATPase/permease subunit
MNAKFSMVVSLLRPYRGQLIVATAVTAVLTLLSQTPPLLVRFLIDRVIEPGRWELLGLVVLGFAVLPVLRGGGSLISTVMLSLTGQRFVFDLRRRLVAHLSALGERFYQSMPAGTLLNRVMADSAFIQNMITGRTIHYLHDVIYALFAVVMMVYLNASLSVVVLVILPLYLVNYLWFRPRIALRRRLWLRQVDQMSAFLQERIAAAQTVRAYAREYAELQNFVGHHTACHDLALTSNWYTGIFTALAQLITGWSMAVVYCFGCYRVLEGAMTYGDVVAFCAYASMLFTPMVRLTGMASELIQTGVSLDRLSELERAEPDVVERAGAPALGPVRGEVRFDHVWFAYEGEQYVLREIDLEIPAGTSVALVGHTGCGKTTVANLLLRNFDPSRGAIRVDGTDLREVTLDSLRRQTAMVFQDSIVFHASIRENIAYGRPEASAAEVAGAARVAELHEFVERLPEGYETLLGEGGVVLSAGQKQRLSIARAVLVDPRVLILDEATSSVDPMAEAQIKRAMENVMANRTTFVIAHRLTTVVKMDRIVVLDQGRIVESGTHEELIARKGHYFELFEQQMKLMPRL